MVRIVVVMMLFVKNLKTQRKRGKMIVSDEGAAALITTTMIQESRFALVKLVQQKHFKEEYYWLKLMEGKDSDFRRLNKNCGISQLELIIDESNSICVVEKCKILISVMIAKIQYCSPKREKYQISSLCIAIARLLMEFVVSL